MVGLLYLLAFSTRTIARRSQDGTNQMVDSAINRSVDGSDTRCCEKVFGITASCRTCRPYSVSTRAFGVPPACSALPDLPRPAARPARLAISPPVEQLPTSVSGCDPHPPSSGLANGMVEGRAVGEDLAERAEAPSPPGPGPPSSRISGTLQTAGSFVAIKVSFPSPPGRCNPSVILDR